MSLKLFEDESSETITINKAFADSYHKNKTHRLDDNFILNPDHPQAIDRELQNTLSLLKEKNPVIYSKDFSIQYSQVLDEDKTKSNKKLTLKEYQNYKKELKTKKSSAPNKFICTPDIPDDIFIVKNQSQEIIVPPINLVTAPVPRFLSADISKQLMRKSLIGDKREKKAFKRKQMKEKKERKRLKFLEEIKRKRTQCKSKIVQCIKSLERVIGKSLFYKAKQDDDFENLERLIKEIQLNGEIDQENVSKVSMEIMDLIQEYRQYQFEDFIDDMPTRFRYRKVLPNQFGLSMDEIWKAEDKELNKWVSLKKAVQYRSDQQDRYDKTAYERRSGKKDKILTSIYYKKDEQQSKQQKSNMKNDITKHEDTDRLKLYGIKSKK